MDQFILLGDSITQQAFSGGRFGSLLSDYYIRRLDVINRGFSGYNTSQALAVLPKFMPTPQQASVRFMTVWFGANDARLKDTPGGPQQHVPIEDFKNNLRTIATHDCVKAHEHVQIILITPPPVDERKMYEEDKLKYPDEPEIANVARRTASTTAKYARAVRELGQELGVPVLDIWSSMMSAVGRSFADADDDDLPGCWRAPPSQALDQYLSDGLHFNPVAYDLLFAELQDLIEKKFPDNTPERLPYVFPDWKDETAWSDGKLIDG